MLRDIHYPLRSALRISHLHLDRYIQSGLESNVNVFVGGVTCKYSNTVIGFLIAGYYSRWRKTNHNKQLDLVPGNHAWVEKQVTDIKFPSRVAVDM